MLCKAKKKIHSKLVQYEPTVLLVLNDLHSVLDYDLGIWRDGDWAESEKTGPEIDVDSGGIMTVERLYFKNM